MEEDKKKVEYEELAIELEKLRTKSLIAGSIIPQICGLSCVIGGIILLILGITGSADLLIESKGFTAKLVNSSPGVVMMFIGFLITFVSIPKQSSHLKITDKGFVTGSSVRHGMFIRSDGRSILGNGNLSKESYSKMFKDDKSHNKLLHRTS